MSITAVCACGKKIQVKDELAGKRGKCPACGKAMTIPMPAAATIAPTDQDPLGVGGLGGLDLGSLGGLEGDPLGGDPLSGDPLAGPAPTVTLGGPLGGSLPAGGPGRALPGVAKPAAGKATPAAEESPWYKKWYVLAGGGAAVLLFLVVGIVGILFAFGAFSSAPTVASTPTNNTPAPPPPAPKEEKKDTGPPKWKVSATDVTIDQGATIVVDVSVDRAGFNDAIQLAVEGLPEKVNTADVEIAADSSATQLVFQAASDAVEASKPIKLVATSGAAKVEKQITLAVKKPLLPNLPPVAAASLSPGQATSVAVKVERNGLAGEIQVQVDGLPDKVTAQPLTIAADQTAGTLQLSAAADAVATQKAAKLTASVGGKTVESALQVNVETFAVKIQPILLPVVWLAPGETAALDVNLDRAKFKGPIELDVQGLPENVSVAPLMLGGDQSTGKLVIKAAVDAKEKVRSGKIVGKTSAGNFSHLLIVRVKKGDGLLLPEAAIDPELGNLLKRGSFGGRLTKESKAMLGDLFGGTKESEAAVMAGLKWLDRHQAEDGHWAMEGYHVHGGNCECKVASEKDVPANDCAGTAMGVLPFLGAGITPTSAPESSREFKKYQKTVKSALASLIRGQTISKDDNTNGELGKNMYAHALATIALCEAYALTQDDEYKLPSQRAVRYLIKAQHANGGWGYSPKTDGDTSVVGWVFLAIRSGQLSGMPVEVDVISKANKFLDATAAGDSEVNRKARYSYRPKTGPTLSLTAAGLLTRMYAGWQRDKPELGDGCDFLMQTMPVAEVPTVGTSYYYYYATNVLHHMEGKKWDLWNHYMREHLLRTQERDGHKGGSWSPEGVDFGPQGGRLYSTCLSLLTLEVYYRHLPLYNKISKGSSSSQ